MLAAMQTRSRHNLAPSPSGQNIFVVEAGDLGADRAANLGSRPVFELDVLEECVALLLGSQSIIPMPGDSSG